MKNFQIDLILGFATVLFSIGFLYETTFFRGDPRCVVYPRTVLIVLLITGLALVIKNSINKFKDKSIYQKEGSLKPIFFIIVASGLYFYLAEKIGFYSITFLFFSMSALIARRSKSIPVNLRILLVTISFTLFLFICFYVLIEAPAPAFVVDSIFDYIRAVE